jgi:hypothetical protein
VALIRTDVSEDRIASTFRVHECEEVTERSCKLLYRHRLDLKSYIKWAVFRLLMLVSRLEFSSALKMKAEAYVPLKRRAFLRPTRGQNTKNCTLSKE